MVSWKTYIIGLAICLLALFTAAHRVLLADNVRKADHPLVLTIPTGTDYDSVLALIQSQRLLRSVRTFDWVARKMNYPRTIEPGLYRFPGSSSNVTLVRMLRLGNGELTVSIPIHTIDSREELCGTIGRKLEADSATLCRLLGDESFLGQYRLNPENAWGIIMADTYDFYWDTDAASFLDRMHREYNRFWNAERQRLAGEQGISPMDAIILASIIEKESIKPDEYARIAGVYINRLRRDWPLQADPTVKFALGQPGLKRILFEHLAADSPYNTYKYKGLPPGPICLPEKTTVEAVLHAEKHDYMYFCAKADFSGYHVFSRTLSEHNRYAKEYQWALNQSGIY